MTGLFFVCLNMGPYLYACVFHIVQVALFFIKLSIHHDFSVTSFAGTQDCHCQAVVESGMSLKSILILIVGYCLCDTHLSCAVSTSRLI